MKSIDIVKEELRAKYCEALKSGDENKLAKAFEETASQIREDLEGEIRAFKQTNDTEILKRRGVRSLTQKELDFYKGVEKYVKTGDKKAAFEGIENAFPESVIDSVLDDIKTQFPLLSAINIQNTSTLTKMIVNKKGMQMAAWGSLGSKITAELEGSIGTVDVGTNKLTAFMVISKDMLDAGPAWVDAYVRAVLVEALGAGLSNAIILGNGNNCPIGIFKDTEGSVVNGVYPDKSAKKITDLSPKTIGGIAATISQGPNNRLRTVPELLFLVNPLDYFEKVMPATTLMTPSGTYENNVFPYPTKVVQDVNVPRGKGAFGLASRYFMGVGKGGAGGKIEQSDEFRFLDDERVYLTKMYGNGLPLDGNAFVIVDISGLKPLAWLPQAEAPAV